MLMIKMSRWRLLNLMHSWQSAKYITSLYHARHNATSHTAATAEGAGVDWVQADYLHRTSLTNSTSHLTSRPINNNNNNIIIIIIIITKAANAHLVDSSEKVSFQFGISLHFVIIACCLMHPSFNNRRSRFFQLPLHDCGTLCHGTSHQRRHCFKETSEDLPLQSFIPLIHCSACILTSSFPTLLSIFYLLT